ncbi:GtrA family protein [Actinopolyspora erythraea]|uniref:GtrA family protein n=1 Tax=Actinopolyspora erythraea TaxID=414996 RepID=A0A099DBP4_9ACTN|nr:GtrA family protein [Actinopolyspora erythraea]ASU77104.1 GtrA family protein [Actinopolyspora erythraea]KGI83207.1 polysaccharide synthesis protein GtrA [Actinopolyspora erythraea]
MAVAESTAEPETKQLGILNQLVRFGLIGAVCAMLDYGSYMTLLALDLPNWLARTLAFVLGTTASYIANRRLTFAGANTGNTKAKAGAFVLVYVVTFFVNIGTNQLLFLWLPEFGFVYGAQFKWTLCWLAGQALGTGINFVLLRWVVFRE